ncbi:Rrf2 family transcriptional regulator [Candidatus Parcubacteria bacterium]|nr:Rrf2 family transcriptional regulator [Candidatus Parcubacteria bacterium]
MSKQVDYAMQLLIALSKLDKESFLSLRMFSQESNISFLFLQRIARSLKVAGMIDAARGVHGGYFMTREAKGITVKEVIEAVDGPFGITSCSRGKLCPRKGKCTSKKLFDKINKKIEVILDKTPILDAE